jgi:magnesium-transporting ATPase (P-type)
LSSGTSNLQKILITIVVVLVALSLVLCAIVFIFLLVEGEDVRASLGFTVVLLVASIPIAIEIVCTTTLALGSNQLAKHGKQTAMRACRCCTTTLLCTCLTHSLQFLLTVAGAIVTRLAAIEDMAGMAILCSDKTGTLTLNKLVIQEDTPVYRDGENQYSLLRYASMAANWKVRSCSASKCLTALRLTNPIELVGTTARRSGHAGLERSGPGLAEGRQPDRLHPIRPHPEAYGRHHQVRPLKHAISHG